MKNLVEAGSQSLRPLSVSEIISKGLSILFKRYFAFVLPFFILSLIEWPISVIFSALLYIRSQHPALMGILIFGGFASFILTLIFNALSTGIVTQMAADEFLGQETGLRKSFDAALGVILSLIVAAIIVGIVIVIGLMLFIIPGIIFWVWFCLTSTVIVLERKGAFEAMGRSKELVKGNWFHAFVVLLVTIIITFIASLISGVISGIFAWLLPPVLAIFVRKLISSFISPISAVILTVLYFDLSARKTIAEIPPIPPPTPVTPPPPPTPYIETREEIEAEKPPTITYKFCPYCGAQIPPGARFCPRCGASLEAK